MRDPLVEIVGERLVAVYSKAQRLCLEFFPKIDRYDAGYRISIIALMKMIVDLMKLEKESQHERKNV